MKIDALKNKIIRVGCLSASLVSLFAYPVLADDAVIQNWTGPYVGLHGGGIWSDFHNGGATGPNGNDSSLMGGAQIGTNWQVDRIVMGVEGDASVMDLQGNNPASSFDEGYMFTARGRLGYAIDRYLPYITAGAGFTNATSKAPGQGSEDKMHIGAAYGGGVDMMLSQWAGDWAKSGKWFGRVEYLHVDVPKETDTVGATSVRGGSDNDIFRVALNYKF